MDISGHLAGEIRGILKEFGIKPSDITGMVADNTASMPALARELEMKFHGCDGHKLNLVVSHALEVSTTMISSLLVQVCSSNN